MKKPAIKTMVMGHPAVAVPLRLIGGITLLAGFHAGNVLIVIFAVAILGTIQKASAEASAYRAWEREWNGLAPATPRQRRRVWGRAIILALGAALFGVMLSGGASVSDAAICMGLLAGGIGIIAMALRLATCCFKRRRPRRTRSFVVAVVARPGMAVPSLADAYRALPPYCHALLRGQQ
ncbi:MULTISPECIES: hypothetical protein [Sphingomonas]|jgi:4-amino-4-deoxy-L-arabinose transferase-like glycosyltransferase|uniref:hypothetical protein n=1 Tax=Sphingomonas TaxID=13687 RepID=UPI001AEA8592